MNSTQRHQVCKRDNIPILSDDLALRFLFPSPYVARGARDSLLQGGHNARGDGKGGGETAQRGGAHCGGAV